VCGPSVLDGHCLDYRAIAGGTVLLAMRKQGVLHCFMKNSQPAELPRIEPFNASETAGRHKAERAVAPKRKQGDFRLRRLRPRWLTDMRHCQSLKIWCGRREIG
jgi:hypothetical protein